MADFVAVIRRTVDGLSENNPEMRGRVYEKARSAVRRQLENMTPRPSDDMINRQLNKLELAISEVENEHAEALPAIEETEALEQPELLEPDAAEAQAEQEAAAPVSPEPEPVPDEAPEVEQAAAEERIEEAAPEATQAFEEPAPADVPAAEQELPEQREAEPTPAAGPDEHHREPPAASEEPEAVPAEPQWGAPVEEHVPAEEPRPAEEFPPAAEADSWHQAHVDEASEPHAEEFERGEPEPEPVATVGPEEETAPEEPVGEEAPPAEAAPVKQEPSEWALPEWEDVPPAASAGEEPPAAKAQREEAAGPERLGMHPVEPETSAHPQRPAEAETAQAWSFDDSDPFAAPADTRKDKPAEPEVSEWAWPVEKAPAASNEEERAGTAWDHIDDLLGLDEAGRRANGSDAAAKEDDQVGDVAPAAVSPRPASYRVAPKPSRFNVKSLAIAAVILLLLGGGGFAYWVNREAGNAWLSAMLAKIIPAGPETQTPPGREGEPAVQPGEQSGAQEGTALPDDKSSKFTQRLLADGSERDEGPAGANGSEIAQEGKSVAPQTEAGQPQGVAAGPEQAAAQPQQPATNQDSGAPQTEVSIADGEKMFLYEERLGQSSPTAVPGAVAWSIKEESPGGDAKPEPAIQAQITVPDRGMTALMTIKRNVDPSLPASHVIEFVFSLPENFEGGAIEGVQRVSMKRTEQDRGDPLIAVPAKITDDFHMIALNDFAEAVGSNTELLRSRSWIDIPITYRNGRRALLTLEKGASGTEAFSKAMQAWSSLGSAAAASGQ
ncbi:transmembrane protein [Sinorhizobium americanum CCGM7]|uniref:hypothetical protein n=1 Tax=Sinorhizobium americanum TaxID=194963 RepID=UPI0004D68FA8|nr:hypothetical protein [Sinorhizobium americanum]APG85739.1 transmembrane protein [Sinorhizobium americanum CCGM7]